MAIPSWISVSPTSGTAGTKQVQVTTDPAQVAGDNFDEITVTAGNLSKTVTVHQEGLQNKEFVISGSIRTRTTYSDTPFGTMAFTPGLRIRSSENDEWDRTFPSEDGDILFSEGSNDTWYFDASFTWTMGTDMGSPTEILGLVLVSATPYNVVFDSTGNTRVKLIGGNTSESQAIIDVRDDIESIGTKVFFPFDSSLDISSAASQYFFFETPQSAVTINLTYVY